MEEILLSMSLRQKTVFLTCLAQLTTEELSDDEIDYIIDLAMMCEYPEDKVELIFNPLSEAELIGMLEEIDNVILARILIRELFYLGYADAKLTDEKIVYIMTIAEKVGLTIDDVERISDWVAVGMEWEKLGDELFGKGV